MMYIFNIFNMYIIYVRLYVHMYIWIYVCTYVYMYVRIYVRVSVICVMCNMYNAFIFNIYLGKKNNYTICNKFYFYNTLFLCIQEL